MPWVQMAIKPSTAAFALDETGEPKQRFHDLTYRPHAICGTALLSELIFLNVKTGNKIKYTHPDCIKISMSERSWKQVTSLCMVISLVMLT